ncbi:MAG: putative ABC transporter permease [Clostridia bacterium]|nr:putative ABC transporter permease [Clostridia bacterium]
MEEKTKKNKWYFYVICFFVYCFLGWLYEVAWEFKIGNGFVNRGFLHGCYLPIYGFGGLILIFSLQKLMKKKLKLAKINFTPILVFLLILIVVSTVEFIASWGMEMLFHKRWWDYSYDKFNLNGRISLRNSSLLAICGMIALYLILPIVEKLVSKINIKFQKILATSIIVIMSIDFISVMIGYMIK